MLLGDNTFNNDGYMDFDVIFIDYAGMGCA